MPDGQEPAPGARTPVDAFILAKLEEKGHVRPSPDADQAKRCSRRATYDLIGLPPTPQEVEAFRRRQLARRLRQSRRSPARLARTTASAGAASGSIPPATPTRSAATGTSATSDYRYPYAWTYRDYVIKAFNDDKPYDQFIIEQLAADKLPGSWTGTARRLAALGFSPSASVSATRMTSINDRIDVVSKGFLGHHRGVRPLPRSHVRPDPDEGLLLRCTASSASIEEPKEKPLINKPDQSC